jgi:hypothetical protein
MDQFELVFRSNDFLVKLGQNSEVSGQFSVTRDRLTLSFVRGFAADLEFSVPYTLEGNTFTITENAFFGSLTIWQKL